MPRKRYKNEHVPGEARRRMKAGSAVTGAMVSGGRTAVDLGVRKNTTSNARSGQSFRDVVSGGTEYHVYGDGRKVAVKARPASVLRNTVLKQGQANAPAPSGSHASDVAQMQALHELAAAKHAQAPSTTSDPAKQERQLEMMRRLRAKLGG